MEQGTKSPLLSKTMWLNGIMGLLAFVAMFVPGAEGVKTMLNAHAAEIGMFWSVLNVILRTITKDRIVLGD